MTRNVLEVRDLYVEYVSAPPSPGVTACKGVSFGLAPGEVLGIAGESGCGKSTLITAVARLERMPAVITGGSITLNTSQFGPLDITGMNERQLRPLRWTEVSLVMQSAMDALNPVLRLGAQFEDVLQTHQPRLSRRDARAIATERLQLVGITADRLRAYPHELSGGMRQRASIALALACDPQLVIMDEPTTAVDVVMQRKIVEQILDMRVHLGFAVLFVTHDLSLLMEFADRIAIMYAGEFVEISSARELYRMPLHPYAKGLRDSFPPLFGDTGELHGIPGTPASLSRVPKGCPFHPRCAHAFDTCRSEHPVPTVVEQRLVSCHLHDPARKPSEATQ